MLQSLHVLDLSRLLPGPFCTLILSELGAEVVKVEDTGIGDYLRHFPPQKEGLGGAFYALNRGKRSVAINLKHPEGRDLLLRMVPGFDVVLESYRPGVLQRLGLGFEVLRQARPDLVLCSITGYGQDGPLAGRAGHDIDYLALSGVLASGGAAGGPPALPGVQIADVAGGALWATIRILAALHAGGGVQLDVSMTEGAMAFLLPWLGDMAFGGAPLRRGQATLNGGAACYDSYRCADDGYLAVGALEPKFFSALVQALGLGTDGALNNPMAAPGEQAEQRRRLAQVFATQDRDAWARQLAGADVCVEPVLQMEQLADHPQHRERGMFYTIDDPQRGAVPQLRLPGSTHPATTAAPRQGEHTDTVLAALGIEAAELVRLRQAGIIR